MPEIESSTLAGLQDKATLMRIHSIRATTEAGSGHPTSCASAAEIMSALFFSVMRYDPKDPAHPDNDVFVLSKGHAAPVLYAAWAEAGYIPESELLNLRKITSDLEGHPPTRLPFVDLATGSLGQGLSAGLGIALAARVDGREQRVYVLLGDGESAEGSVWEAAAMASHINVNNLCATIDINRLGQSAPTMLEHDIDTYKNRWEAFGWQALAVDGHNIEELVAAYEQAAATPDRPSVILARTFKGKGIDLAEDQDNWHGKPLPKGEKADGAIQALEAQLNGGDFSWTPKLPSSNGAGPACGRPRRLRRATCWETRLPRARLSVQRWQRWARPIRALWRSTETSRTRPSRRTSKRHARIGFSKASSPNKTWSAPRWGWAARGKIAFAASFACFLSRAYDFMRMAAISNTNVKLVGTHAGISIGEDGPSQMGLEDIAMTCAEPNYTVLYPSDGTSAWRAIELAAATEGPVYVRTSRPATPVIYEASEEFALGKAKVVRQSDNDQVTVVGAGRDIVRSTRRPRATRRGGNQYPCD